MEFFTQFYDVLLFVPQFFVRFDYYLEMAIINYGTLVYLLLFLVVFCETGLVITPLLPGDSLLFIAGAFAGRELLSVALLIPLITIAAIAGDTVNYLVGKYFGEKFFHEKARFLKPLYLDRTYSFFAKYGAKTIVLSRFVPIVRTFAPFVAGLGRMNFAKYMSYNILGGILWVTAFIGAGFIFGELAVVRESMTLLIFGVIGVSLIPLVGTFIKKRRQA